MNNPDIRELSEEELRVVLTQNNFPKFRAKQILNWVWNNGISSFSEMTNIPKDIVTFLEKNYKLHKMCLNNKLKSIDGTVKCTLRLFDDKIIEAVLIPSDKRITVCISSQVGCSLDCSFCATAKLKYERNLTYYEIFDQVFLMNKLSIQEYGVGISNVVYMGMGEPFLNYNAVIKSIEYLNAQDKGLNISKKRITVSTSGIAKMIKKIGEDMPTINLALSLHSANNTKRTNMMSINNSNDLDTLSDAIKYWHNKTGEPITYEYIVWDNLNNSDEDIQQLISFCKKTPCKVNLIEYNIIEGSDFKKASERTLNKYLDRLTKNDIVVTVRKSRGEDINGACGQLARKL